MNTAVATPDRLRERLRRRLAGVVPEFEIDYKASLAWEIEELKKETGAVVLGHNYMEPALYHSVCDHTGDSLELARIASTADADPIVFCGVRFMAETAKILNPDRTVLLPARKAGCSLAASITAADVRRLREAWPGVPVVAYINTYADVKAEVDVCCTSGNARRVIESLDSDVVIFLPDEYLARNVARETGKRIVTVSGREVKAAVGVRGRAGNGGPGSANGAGHDAAGPGTLPVLDAGLIGWTGRCEVHEKFTVDDVADVRAQFPDVTVLAHPECSPEVVAASDFSGSTSAMIRYVREVDAPRYLLLTECAMGDNVAAELPERDMLRLCSVRCPHMNEITLENVRDALLHGRQVIDVPEPIRSRARRSIERMLEIG